MLDAENDDDAESLGDDRQVAEEEQEDAMAVASEDDAGGVDEDSGVEQC